MITKALFHWTATSENINMILESAPVQYRGRFRYDRSGSFTWNEEKEGIKNLKIYAVNIEAFETVQEDSWSEWMDLVDCARRERIGKLKQKKDRVQSIGAGLLLRYSFLQQGCTKEQWEGITIQRGLSGKPSIVQYPEFCYSLSHSGKWVICGVHSKELGADIQEMRPWNIRLAKRFFAAEEYERLVHLEEIQRRQSFYKMWTAKESYAKLTGDGIGNGISQYLTAVGFDKITDTDNGMEAAIKIYELSDYMICVCTREGGCFPKEIEIISLEDLK